MAAKSEPVPGTILQHGKPLKPSTIMHLVYGVYPSFAMLAGMQLDLFTALDSKALTAKSLAESLGVLEDRITPLLYSLVAAGLLENGGWIFLQYRRSRRVSCSWRSDLHGVDERFLQ